MKMAPGLIKYNIEKSLMIPCSSVKMRTTKKKIIMSSKGPDIERLDFIDTVFKGEEGQR